MSERLPRAFFERDVVLVARELVGAVLVHATPTGILAGRVVETEAYRGPEDAAAHSAGGRRTRRTEAMFGQAGTVYMYVVYGRNWAFNVVTGSVGAPHAVLIRAVEPLRGVDEMVARRGLPAPSRTLTSGPGRLCAALGLGPLLAGLDLCAERASVYFEADGGAPPLPAASPRIGVAYAGRWAGVPWRFYDPGSPFVSRRRRTVAEISPLPAKRAKMSTCASGLSDGSRMASSSSPESSPQSRWTGRRSAPG